MISSDPISLAPLREQIDAIDESILEKLEERVRLVKQVGEIKNGQNASLIIRPGREAAMVRRIAAQAEKVGFPRSALVDMWRIIIGSLSRLEQDIQVAVLSSSRDAFWHTRNYYGSATPILPVTDPKAAFDLLKSRKIQVLVVSKEDASWWPELKASPNFRIFACLPFLLNAPHPPLFAIGETSPEPTGEDRSVFLVEAEKISLSLRILYSASPHYLVEIDGFRDALEGSIKEKAVYLGSYATPIYE